MGEPVTSFHPKDVGQISPALQDSPLSTCRGTCSGCGARLPFLRRFSGSSVCPSCEAKERAAVAWARQEYTGLLTLLSTSPIEPTEIQAQLAQLAKSARLDGEELKWLHLKIVKWCLARALTDDCLSEDEEERLKEIYDLLGVDQTTLDAEFGELKPRLIAARANDGRLAVLSSPPIMLKKGEVAYLQASAALLDEVDDRESVGSYRGARYRVVKGSLLHTGGVGGRPTVAEIADIGLLTVTSQRTVFVGQRQSMEMPHAKLLTLNVLSNGIRFYLPDPRNAPLFKLDKGWGSAVAATINAVWQRKSHRNGHRVSRSGPITSSGTRGDCPQVR
jgi:hypothetical protein